VAGVAFDLLWRIAVLSSPISHPLVALITAPAIGRWAMVLALRITSYGAGGKLGAAALRPTPWAVFGATLLLVPLVIKGHAQAVASIVATMIVTWFWIRFVRRRFGALTGDGLGALNELAELLVLGISLLAS